jgi:cell division protein FtsX
MKNFYFFTTFAIFGYSFFNIEKVKNKIIEEIRENVYLNNKVYKEQIEYLNNKIVEIVEIVENEKERTNSTVIVTKKHKGFFKNIL